MRAIAFPFVLTAFMLLSSCGGSSDGEMSSDEYDEHEAFVNQYKAHIDSIYQNLPEFSQLSATNCPAGNFMGSEGILIFEPNELNTSGPGYSLFRADSTTSWLAQNESYFNWFEMNDAWTMKEVADKIRSVVAAKYICVFIEDTASFRMPEMDSTATTYEPGNGAGYALIMDFVSGETVCVLDIHATNSEEVNYTTYGDTALVHTDQLLQLDPRFAINVDLYENIRQEIYRQLLGR